MKIIGGRCYEAVKKAHNKWRVVWVRSGRDTPKLSRWEDGREARLAEFKTEAEAREHLDMIADGRRKNLD